MTTRLWTLLVAAVLPLCTFVGNAIAQPLDPPSVHVRIVPVLIDEVSGVAWNAMKDECRLIWQAEGIVIIWDDHPLEASPRELQVPLVVDDMELRKHAPGHADAFGLTIFAGRTQRVLVSIPRIRNLVSARGRSADLGDSILFDVAVGRVLGRVVAHEVGHVLLLSTRHATTGLMSPSLQTDHLGAFDPAFDRLSAPDQARLAIRFGNAGKSEPRGAASPPVLARGAGPGGATVVPGTFQNAP